MKILYNKLQQSFQFILKTKDKRMIDEQTFKLQITKHDQIKTWEKKLQILKKGLLDERQFKKQLTSALKLKKERFEKLEGQIQWKNRQNQTLNKQIKVIKDQILEQRNKKRKLREQLISFENNINQSGSDQTKDY